MRFRLLPFALLAFAACGDEPADEADGRGARGGSSSIGKGGSSSFQPAAGASGKGQGQGGADQFGSGGSVIGSSGTAGTGGSAGGPSAGTGGGTSTGGAQASGGTTGKGGTTSAGGSVSTGGSTSGGSGGTGVSGKGGAAGSGTSGSGGTGSSGKGGSGGAPGCVTEICGNGIDDDCDGDVDETCICPADGAIPGLTEHDGLRAITPGSFAVVDTNEWATNATRISSWSLPTVGVAALPLNRTGTKIANLSIPDFNLGFAWEAGDAKVQYWTPQGLAGGSSGAKKMLVASWHYDECHNTTDDNVRIDGTIDKGVRVSFVDVTNAAGPFPYRHALLVEPTATGFKHVGIHAGGISWVGHYLYVVDTSKGFRVFDLDQIKQVSDAAACANRIGPYQGSYCAAGYAYVLPQVAAYTLPKGFPTSCRPVFSVLGKDTSSTVEALLSAEYRSDSIYGRLFRWPLAANGKLAADGNGVVHPNGAFYMGNRNVQGVAGENSKYWLSSTRYCGSVFAGKADEKSVVRKVSDNTWGPLSEGVHLSAAGNLWTLTEGKFPMTCNTAACSAAECASSTCGDSARIVYAVKPAP